MNYKARNMRAVIYKGKKHKFSSTRDVEFLEMQRTSPDRHRTQAAGHGIHSSSFL